MVCDDLDPQHIRCHAVQQGKRKPVENELSQIRINRMTDLGMLE